MTWFTLACATIAAACTTLAGVHLVIWLRSRRSFAHLGFSTLAIGVAWFTWAEHAVARARTPTEAAAGFQWIHGGIFLMVLGIVVFVRHYLPTARAWLGTGALAVHTAVLLAGFPRPYSADFDDITGVATFVFAGERFSTAVGDTSAWHWVGQAGFLLLVVFVIDAAVRLWRTGTPIERHRALTIGGSIAFFALAGPIWAALIFSSTVLWPHVEFVFFLPAVLAMGYELGEDVLRAARLTGELQVSEASARELSGRLINAQEDERRRIARDLHDDLSQRLALAAIEIDLLGQSPVAQEASARIQHASGAVREIATDVHRLAYELHPAKLDQLGLDTAARAWCRDLSAQSGVVIGVASASVSSQLPPHIALCAYRILQESLQNVVRHSGSRVARVEISQDAAGLRLRVSDEGRGFQADRTSGSGLGLVSMKERARLVGGTFRVRSAPGAGTAIDVTIPVADTRPVGRSGP
jgi:signal transduction histidine kinase